MSALVVFHFLAVRATFPVTHIKCFSRFLARSDRNHPNKKTALLPVRLFVVILFFTDTIIAYINVFFCVVFI